MSRAVSPLYPGGREDEAGVRDHAGIPGQAVRQVLTRYRLRLPLRVTGIPSPVLRPREVLRNP